MATFLAYEGKMACILLTKPGHIMSGNMKKSVLLLLFTVLSVAYYAQNQDAVDSISSLLKATNVDTSIVRYNIDLSNEYIFNHPDTASYFIGNAFEKAEEIGDTSRLAECYNHYGIIGVLQGRYLTGIENFQLSLELYEAVGDLDGASNIINNIGVIYGYMENYTEAIEHYKESHAISEKLGDFEGCALGLFNITTDYLALENFDSARRYLVALDEFQLLHEEFISADPLWGEIFLHEKMLDSALVRFESGYQKNLANQDDIQALSCQTGVAEVLKEQKKYVESLQQLRMVEEISIENGYNDMILDVLELRGRIFQERGDFETAYKFQAEYLALKDSLDDINNVNRISELNAKYEAEKRQSEITEMEMAMATSRERELARKRIVIIAGICILAIIATMIVSLIRKKRTNRVLNNQNNEILDQRQKILSSINYAKKIQNSILIPEHFIQKSLPESFVYFRPKDIVSGDFYWFTNIGKKIMISTIDCTGHGVPGAFMSIIANNKLNKVVNEMNITEPSEVLQQVHNEMVVSLNQHDFTETAQDGMDMSLCLIDLEERTLKFAGAHNPIYLVNNGNLREMQADPLTIGGTILDSKLNGSFRFSTKETTFEEDTFLFMFTDGYLDQFGGKDNKKMNKKRFKEIVVNMANGSFHKAKELFEKQFNNWKGDNPQIDDVLIIGAKL